MSFYSMLKGKVLIAVDSEMTCHQIQAYLIHGSQKVMRQLLSKLEEPQQSKEVGWKGFFRDFGKIIAKICHSCITLQWSCDGWMPTPKLQCVYPANGVDCWGCPGLFWNRDCGLIYEGSLWIYNASDLLNQNPNFIMLTSGCWYMYIVLCFFWLGPFMRN